MPLGMWLSVEIVMFPYVTTPPPANRRFAGGGYVFYGFIVPYKAFNTDEVFTLKSEILFYYYVVVINQARIKT